MLWKVPEREVNFLLLSRFSLVIHFCFLYFTSHLFWDCSWWTAIIKSQQHEATLVKKFHWGIPGATSIAVPLREGTRNVVVLFDFYYTLLSLFLSFLQLAQTTFPRRIRGLGDRNNALDDFKWSKIWCLCMSYLQTALLVDMLRQGSVPLPVALQNASLGNQTSILMSSGDAF